jgi:hypothetical protein
VHRAVSVKSEHFHHGFRYRLSVAYFPDASSHDLRYRAELDELEDLRPGRRQVLPSPPHRWFGPAPCAAAAGCARIIENVIDRLLETETLGGHPRRVVVEEPHVGRRVEPQIEAPVSAVRR